MAKRKATANETSTPPENTAPDRASVKSIESEPTVVDGGSHQSSSSSTDCQIDDFYFTPYKIETLTRTIPEQEESRDPPRLPARGRVIRRLREERGLERIDIVVEAGVSDSALQRMEGGNIVETAHLRSIAAFFDVPLSRVAAVPPDLPDITSSVFKAMTQIVYAHLWDELPLLEIVDGQVIKRDLKHVVLTKWKNPEVLDLGLSLQKWDVVFDRLVKLGFFFRGQDGGIYHCDAEPANAIILLYQHNVFLESQLGFQAARRLTFSDDELSTLKGLSKSICQLTEDDPDNVNFAVVLAAMQLFYTCLCKTAPPTNTIAAGYCTAWEKFLMAAAALAIGRDKPITYSPVLCELVLLVRDRMDIICDFVAGERTTEDFRHQMDLNVKHFLAHYKGIKNISSRLRV